MKLCMGLLLVVFISSCCFADSDSTGILRGSTEKLSVLLTNSTGSFDNSSNCSISVAYEGTVLVNYANMVNDDRGAYSYSWAVPADLGTYWMSVNCTTASKENYTDGGSMFIVDKLLEKKVAVGVARYEDAYKEQYGIVSGVTTPILSTNWFEISLGTGVLIIIGLLLYNAYKQR